MEDIFRVKTQLVVLPHFLLDWVVRHSITSKIRIETIGVYQDMQKTRRKTNSLH